MRIGFLFNHDQTHQVAHSLPIAMALARAGVAAEIVVATTNPRLTAEVRRMAGSLLGSRLRLVELNLRRPTSRLVSATLGLILPAEKLVIYRDNLDFFRSLDVLVVAEKTSLVLKTLYGLRDLKIVYTSHGAGDRAIGFDAANAECDLLLIAGPKIRDRMIADAGVAPERLVIVGYPKFDCLEAPPDLGPVIEDGRPVVVYNPHPAPHLSSWYVAGRKVLDWFADQDDYHLIFAPHVMLFERPVTLTIDPPGIHWAGQIADRFLRAPNIHIDLGSRASTTMAYTQRADIYLGDASSQIYEFLLRPRPCVFLNPMGLSWAGDANFAHWRAGPVIENVADLGAALGRARAEHAGVYRPVQQRLFDSTFDLTDEPSSERAARALARFTGLSPARRPPAEARTPDLAPAA